MVFTKNISSISPISFELLLYVFFHRNLLEVNDISKNYISTLDADTVYEDAVLWAKDYNEKLYKLLSENDSYAKSIFAIERGNAKPRKDISKWLDVENYVAYFYDELWDRNRDFDENISKEDSLQIIEEYKNIYDQLS